MPVTPEEWEAQFDKTRLHLQNDRGVHPVQAWRQSRILTARKLGPQPREIKPPLWMRLALWYLGKKLEKGMEPVEVSMLKQKVIVALVFGVAAAAPVLNAAFGDNVLTGAEVTALVGAFVGAAWGKFSSNTTVIAPSRRGETVHGPQ